MTTNERATVTRESSNTALRMWMALKILRAWNDGPAGYDGEVVSIVHAWIDEGMNGPIPMPQSPFFREWAEANGFFEASGGCIGFRMLMELRDGE